MNIYLNNLFKYIVLTGILAWTGIQPVFAVPVSGELIILMQPGAPLSDSFEQHHLDEIKKIAEALKTEVRVVDVRNGTPPEVAITPLLVYQNYRGRSIYQGRTTTPDRVKNFIRTSRSVPQGQTPLVREDTPVMEYGRARIWSPVKIAPVTGTVPPDYDHALFVREARQAIEKGFEKFHTQKRVELGRADRGFYMDFYPWLSEDGTLFLSLAIFSQFHCKEPVFTKKITSIWKDREKLFEQAGAIMEKAVADCVADAEGGDGFDPVGADVKAVSWESAGLPLPPAPEKKNGDSDVNVTLPGAWVMDQAGPDDPPMIQFRFPAPLDQYSGEVSSVRGEFRFAESLIPGTLKGFVEADPASVTMGEADLDKALQGSIFLDTKKYPVSGFSIESASGESQPLIYGHLSPVSLSGTFTLKGKHVPLSVMMEMEPVLGDDEKPRLLARGEFQIHLDDFGIQGADGPVPASKTLIFDLNLVFKAADR